MIRGTEAGIELDVRVIPRARQSTIDGQRGDALLVRLAAPPVDNAANDALLRFLSETLGVSRRAVRLMSGARGRTKRVEIAGVNEAQARRLLRV